MDVLVFTPIYRLEPETVQALFSLEWDGPLSFLLQRDNPYKLFQGRNDGMANHLHQYKRGRETFLAGAYDAMLVVESDVIVPPDTVQRLAALDCDVAYGVYVFRNNRRPIVNIFERYFKGNKKARNVGESLSLRGMWPETRNEGPALCSGGGLGCVLIKRHVLEAIPFRIEPNRGHCDTPWTNDVYSAGYKMMYDPAVICGHKDEDGTILWPEE